MTEKFDPKEVEKFDGWRGGTGGRALFHHLLISSIAKVRKDRGDKIVEEYHRGNCEVGLTINGVEVPIVKVCEEWDQQVNRMVAEEALKLFDTKFRAFRDTLDDAHRSFDALRRGLMMKMEKELGVKFSEDDYEGMRG